MKWGICLLFIVALHVGASSQKKDLDFDISAPDGAKLRATYYSPGKPGPGILLLHQCNMDRKSWRSLAAALAQRGIHVMTFDYRGYGETTASGGRENLSTDIDAAFGTLKSQPGVDKNRLAAGGASCGVDNSVQLARRSGQIKALMLLTGPTTQEGLAFLKGHPDIAMFVADESGFVSGIRTMVQSSTNQASTMREVNKGWHGVTMFDEDPSLLPTIADWLAKVLR